MVEPTVISTFAGCGGSSLGYKWAGFKELLAIDNDKNAVETFELNFDVPIWNRDISTVTVNEILDFCKIKVGDLDVLDGSPPCQGFSTAGKRKVSDERNDLFKEYVRLIEGLQPKVFVMENVSGMIKGKMKGKYLEIIQTLKALNYNVKVKLMNAKYYQVPQSRERLFFIGVRKDLNKEPVFPESCKELITVSQAIKDIIVNKSELELTSLYKKYWNETKIGGIMGKQNTSVKLNPNKPARTLTKSESNGSFYHYSECRKLDIKEHLSLCSFPIDFKMTGCYKDKIMRLGNAVMPKMMEAIAKTIKEKTLK